MASIRYFIELLGRLDAISRIHRLSPARFLALSAAVTVLTCAVSHPVVGQTVGGARLTAGAEMAPQPGDVIRVRIWREPDLSGDFTVDEKGMVVLPRLGPLQVTREPADSLEAKLVRGFASYLSHSAIEVTLLRRVKVLGAVRDPGLYPLDATMTIGDAVALAGGVTPEGRADQIEVIRNGLALPDKLSPEARISDTTIQSGDEIYVPERGWISRNPGVFAGLISATATLIFALTR